MASLVLWVSGHCKSLFLEALFLQEVSHACPVGGGDGGQHAVSSVEVTAHHGCLVLQHRDEEFIRHHIEFFITKVQPVLFGNVAKEVESPGGGIKVMLNARYRSILYQLQWVS